MSALEEGARFDLSDELRECALFRFDLESGAISEGGRCTAGELSFLRLSLEEGGEVEISYALSLWGNSDLFEE